jgi:steroid delta-isomerase-like uncharacterized protein
VASSDELISRMGGGLRALAQPRSVSLGGSDAIDPGVPDHRDPVMTCHTARSNPGSTGRAPPFPGTIRQNSEERAMTTTTEQLKANKKLARDYIDQVFNQHNPSKAADFVTGDVVWHGNSLGDLAGAENLAGLLGSFIGALPDLYAAEQDITAENDLVMVRLVVTATVKGSLLGVSADGKPVRWNAVDIYRVTDGKISEEWAADDIATIMAQLGVFSPPWAA